MISIRPFAVGVLAIGVFSCTVTPTEVVEHDPPPWLLIAWTGPPDASSPFICTLSVFIDLPNPVPESWDGHAQWSLYGRHQDRSLLGRSLDGGITQFNMRGYGTDSVQIVVTSEVRSDTLRGTPNYPGAQEVGGAWGCGRDFPFASDSALVAAGQDSLAVRNGLWYMAHSLGPIE